MSKQSIILLILAGALGLMTWRQIPEKTNAQRLAELKTVYILLEPGTQFANTDQPSGSIPLLYRKTMFPGPHDDPYEGDALAAYTSEALIPSGSTYCELSVAQAFLTTLNDEPSYGIALDPGSDPKLSMIIPDGDVIAALQNVKDQAPLPWVAKVK